MTCVTRIMPGKKTIFGFTKTCICKWDDAIVSLIFWIFVLHDIPKYSLWMNELLSVLLWWANTNICRNKHWTYQPLSLQKHDQHFNKSIFDVMTNYKNKQKCVGIFYSNRITYVSYVNKQNKNSKWIKSLDILGFK